MGTTRIKVIDLSSDKQEIKTSRKHAEKLTGSPRKLGEAGAAKIKEEKKPKEQKPAITEIKHEDSESVSTENHPQGEKKVSKSVPSAVAKKSTHHLGMKYLTAAKLIDKNHAYPPKEAIDLLYKTSITKFDPTVEIHLNVTDKNVKAAVNFPHAVGGKTKEKKYLVFSDRTTNINNVVWGDEKTIAEIEIGKLKPKRDFDVVIATPKFMPQLAKVAKILGPAGVMPNPKNGTVAENPQKIIEGSSQNSGTDLRTEPMSPIIHTKIGKLSFKPNQLEENLKALIFGIGPTKIQKAIIKSTMSPAIKLDISAVTK